MLNHDILPGAILELHLGITSHLPSVLTPAGRLQCWMSYGTRDFFSGKLAMENHHF